jgi:phosphatidylinositol-3-phosphatase
LRNGALAEILDEEARKHRRERARVPVENLDGDADARTHERVRVQPLRADLAENGTAARRDDARIEIAVRAADVFRKRSHRRAHSRGRGVGGRSESPVRRGELHERCAKDRHSATVDDDRRLMFVAPKRRQERCREKPLHGVLLVDIVLRWNVQMPAQCKHRRVLPGTIVRDRRPDDDTALACRAAQQRRLIEPDTREKTPHGDDVTLLAVVRARRERDVDLGETERLRGTAANELDRDKRLREGSHRNVDVALADLDDDFAVGSNGTGPEAMNGFEVRAAVDFHTRPRCKRSHLDTIAPGESPCIGEIPMAPYGILIEMHFRIRVPALLAAFIALLGATASAPRDAQVPRYTYIFVIMEENKDYDEIIGGTDAPTISALAKTYGLATRFYAETHPSEPNYVALVGGYTYGIRDDDAFYCKPGMSKAHCPNAARPGYVDHTIDATNLATQLESAHLSWKNYNESLPAPGSLAVVASDPNAADVPRDLLVYASKHSGFVNFASVQRDPRRSEHIVGFDQLTHDLRSGNAPNFSLIIPNLCNEMHGSGDDDAPEDCEFRYLHKLIWRGDQNIKRIVAEITSSSVWTGTANAAIVITFDEDDGGGTSGCCGNDPADPANRGGGHIATIVVTNHGPRGVRDSTPYNHYSLLRTIEDAFGIHDYLQRAASPGVVPMLPLFATSAAPVHRE